MWKGEPNGRGRHSSSRTSPADRHIPPGLPSYSLHIMAGPPSTPQLHIHPRALYQSIVSATPSASEISCR